MAKKKEFETEDDLTKDIDFARNLLKGELVNLNETHDYFLTGCPPLDAFLGCGGFPKYQLEYIWGTNSIGKSTLALQILASFQKQYGAANSICLYIDREESVTSIRVKNLGAIEKRFSLLKVNHIEHISELITKVHNAYRENAAYKNKKIDIFVIWDTIAMTPAKESTEGYDKIGAQARSLATMFKTLSFYDLNLTMFALNQHREVIAANSKYLPKDPPGGNAVKHKSFVTINGTSKKSALWPDGYNEGKCTTFTTIKSKLISPHRSMVFEYTYVHGYDAILTGINFLWKDLKVLDKVKGGWKFANEDAKFTLKNLYQFFLTDESVPKWKVLIEGIYDKLYPQDDPIFIEAAKKRIYDYYFPKDKIMLDRFTSINTKVVNSTSAEIDAVDPEIAGIIADTEPDTEEQEG